MDYLALMACYAAGVISLIFAAKNPEAGFLTHMFATGAGLYLAIGFVILGLETHAFSPVEWTGEAETGPVTALVLLLAVSLPFITGWDRENGNRRR
jgi:hypothetical protein